MHDAMVATARAQERTVPGVGTDAAVMASERPHELALVRVPDLQLARMRANAEEGAIAGPLDARDAVIRSDVVQLGHLA